jgi:hypothetical protein
LVTMTRNKKQIKREKWGTCTMDTAPAAPQTKRSRLRSQPTRGALPVPQPVRVGTVGGFVGEAQGEGTSWRPPSSSRTCSRARGVTKPRSARREKLHGQKLHEVRETESCSSPPNGVESLARDVFENTTRCEGDIPRRSERGARRTARCRNGGHRWSSQASTSTSPRAGGHADGAPRLRARVGMTRARRPVKYSVAHASVSVRSSVLSCSWQSKVYRGARHAPAEALRSGGPAAPPPPLDPPPFLLFPLPRPVLYCSYCSFVPPTAPQGMGAPRRGRTRRDELFCRAAGEAPRYAASYLLLATTAASGRAAMCCSVASHLHRPAGSASAGCSRERPWRASTPEGRANWSNRWAAVQTGQRSNLSSAARRCRRPRSSRVERYTIIARPKGRKASQSAAGCAQNTWARQNTITVKIPK